MNAAQLARSDRLRRVDELLSDGVPRTTREIIEQAHVVAVSAIAAELRQQGRNIVCRRKGDRWWYQIQVENSRQDAQDCAGSKNDAEGIPRQGAGKKSEHVSREKAA